MATRWSATWSRLLFIGSARRAVSVAEPTMRPVRRIGIALGLALAACSAPVAAPDAADASYVIEKSSIALANGRDETPVAPGYAAKAVTTLTQKAVGDVDGDGRNDVAVVLIHEPGGSGSFTYVAVVLNASTGAKATNTVLIGDRVAGQAVRLDGKTIVIDYLDRRAGEAFSVAPSVPTTKRFVIKDGALVPA